GGFVAVAWLEGGLAVGPGHTVGVDALDAGRASHRAIVREFVPSHVVVGYAVLGDVTFTVIGRFAAAFGPELQLVVGVEETAATVDVFAILSVQHGSCGMLNPSLAASSSPIIQQFHE